MLETESVLWMFDVYSWALRNLNAEVFFEHTILVCPSNAHFPGHVDSPLAMADLIFKRVVDFAGLNHWPLRLEPESSIESLVTPQLQIGGELRGTGTLTITTQSSNDGLVVPYSSDLLRDPEVLIATYAHNLAHYLGSAVQEPPPGGLENWPHITELLAVFLGFGAIMANTAFTTKIRSCASCAGPSVERTNYLSQYDMTYALAIFANLKDIPANQVSAVLKKTLRPFYKRAHQEVKHRRDDLERLLALRNFKSMTNDRITSAH